MKNLLKVSVVVTLCCLMLAPGAKSAGIAERPSARGPAPRAYRFINGLWLSGGSFKARTTYSVGGVFRMSYRGKVDETIDLGGKFVVPPFAEAHTHHFMEGMDYRSLIDDYFARGIFYAMNTNSLKKLSDPIRSYFNKPEGIDVIYANGGLTATGGHPVQIYDYLAGQNILPGMSREDMKNQAYFIIDNEADLDSAWGIIKAGKPDFIKVYLEYSEEYQARKDDPKYYGKKGLDPALLPRIVARAHADGLRVAAHIDTAMDFHNALVAGVDIMAHLPLARITDADARMAASRKTIVVTTTMSHRKTDHVSGLDDINRHNLRLLHGAGVRLAVGTDDNSRTALAEAENLHRLGVFDNLTLVRLWSEASAQAIFPGRKIGLLEEGYEASFLALEGNPVDDFSNVKRIAFRFKQGHVIGAPGARAGSK
ncbi:MAG TPA: amidohydrolase family protein [Blastocatellia bacterium]|jgi:hypothetical protein|nr:amidohydrolase family protein [Blastocatellia bacterium]